MQIVEIIRSYPNGLTIGTNAHNELIILDTHSPERNIRYCKSYIIDLIADIITETGVTMDEIKLSMELDNETN